MKRIDNLLKEIHYLAEVLYEQDDSTADHTAEAR